MILVMRTLRSHGMNGEEKLEAREGTVTECKL